MSPGEFTRLDRIKKIARHRNGTVTTEKCLKFQELWCTTWPPENSGSREIFISSFRHFESKFRWNFEKVPWNFFMNFGTNKKWGSHISALDFGYLQSQINSGYFGINDFPSSKQILSSVFTKEILEKTRGLENEKLWFQNYLN
jgi:hypothetical protein